MAQPGQHENKKSRANERRGEMNGVREGPHYQGAEEHASIGDSAQPAYRDPV